MTPRERNKPGRSRPAETSFTNHFVKVATGSERGCGHRHPDAFAALECSLAHKREGEEVITYRDDAEGRWQFIGGWARVDRPGA